MIFTRTWLSEFIDLKGISLEQLTAKLNEIGIEVDNAYPLRVPDKVVVGLVKEKGKVENADKLSLCKVDVGEKEPLQIVCGAKNVAAGQYVAVALVGASLPNGVSIKKAKLRGVESEGMICSSTELGFAKINDGIMVLDGSIGELKLGKALNEYEFFNDEFVEVELTPNRGDCLSVYGIARELSAGFDRDLKKLQSYKESKENPVVGRLLRLVADKNLKTSFDYRLIEYDKDTSGTSLKVRMRLGFIDKISDSKIANLLNHATHSTGVLFNAYDLSTLSHTSEEETLHIKRGKSGESKIYHEDELLSVSGIYQEKVAQISENSNVIIIEANYTEPSVIAVAKNAYKKQDEDTVYRSFRGSEPQLNLGVEYLLNGMSSCSSIKIFSSYQQISVPKKLPDIRLDIAEISKCIGKDIEPNTAANILKRLGFSINSVDKGIFSVKPPIYRGDISNFADLSEEIMRIIGIDNIPAKPLTLTERTRLNECYFEYRNLRTLRHKAVANGYFESVHYVLDSEEELNKLGFKTPKIRLVNPISTELNTLRSTLINHLLNAVSFNAKNSRKIIKLFTSGAVFDEGATQKEKIAFVFSGYKDEPKISNKAKPEFVGFYDFLLEMKGIIGDFSLAHSHYGFLSPFEQASVRKNGREIGFVGRVHLGIERHKDLQKTYLCELDLSALKSEIKIAKPYSKFPQISRDLSIIIPKGYEYEKIKECINALQIDILKGFRVVDLYEDKALQDAYSLTINLIFQDEQKTLEEAQVAEKMETIIKALSENLGLKLR